MNWKKFGSSIGYKVFVSISGLLLFLFVFFHIIGNMQLYYSADKLNQYAYFLQHLGPLLWIMRISLLLILLIHIIFAIGLTIENFMARPIPYKKRKYVEASIFSRTMWISGILIFIFLGYHLLQFTLHVINPEISGSVDSMGRHDVYKMVVLGFKEPGISLSYILAMIFLGFHLQHGIPSLFQTLGLNHPKYNKIIEIGGPLIGWVIVVIAISFPVSVLLGIINFSGGTP